MPENEAISAVRRTDALNCIFEVIEKAAEVAMTMPADSQATSGQDVGTSPPKTESQTSSTVRQTKSKNGQIRKTKLLIPPKHTRSKEGSPSRNRKR